VSYASSKREPSLDRGLQDAFAELGYRGAPNDRSGQHIMYVFIQLNNFRELNLTDGNRKAILLPPEITIRYTDYFSMVAIKASRLVLPRVVVP
jgi:hypothetical protein